MTAIILGLSTAKDLDALPRGGARAGGRGLNRYAMTGQVDVKALQGGDGYRLRIGSDRVICDEDATTIVAIHLGRRAMSAPRIIRTPGDDERVVPPKDPDSAPLDLPRGSTIDPSGACAASPPATGQGYTP